MPILKGWATEDAVALTSDAIQVHGGMGYTFEHNAHLYLKRAIVYKHLFAGASGVLAELLDLNPASCLHHVRTLVDTGFLVEQETRRGARGSRERPYLASGKSYYVDTGPGSAEGQDLQCSFRSEGELPDLLQQLLDSCCPHRVCTFGIARCCLRARSWRLSNGLLWVPP